MAEFHEYDVVRVTQLLQPDRPLIGYESIKRPSQAVDKGSIVECIASDGSTIWIADFMTDELE